MIVVRRRDRPNSFFVCWRRTLTLDIHVESCTSSDITSSWSLVRIKPGTCDMGYTKSTSLCGIFGLLVHFMDIVVEASNNRVLINSMIRHNGAKISVCLFIYLLDPGFVFTNYYRIDISKY